ncbi:endo-1,3(4)-beta-glucanase [Tolypocladium capitatum]|uniref:Endo-1,3(4)-beta-glucanase n=1 Tax=Tolypocladium capitatum TaxID=45235 RepID=A0A2K3QML2_9HYPO|nr:endo-1,3(4)-beta-glucanase [Tolypocladium capitatum]
MAYSLVTSYAGESLLSGFNWFDGRDPSNGYVAYQSRNNAEAMGLFSVDESTGVVRLGVDHTHTYGLNEGRPSIRLESKEAYNEGLFIADFLHMPPSQCGLWPAFWSYGTGTTWPNGGEVDIVEGANTAPQNLMSAHTADGCTQSPSLAGLFSGKQRNVDCAVGSNNIGCGFGPPANDTSSYGDGFNAVDGGVYAMQWSSKHIKIWHFARAAIPRDIQRKKPDPRGWKLPEAVFGGSSCDVSSFFKNMSLVININFCGDFGNAVWGKTDQCNNYAPTCDEYVGNNPQAFANAYWDVRYIDAYQLSNSAAAPTAEPTTTTVTSIWTTTVTVGGTGGPDIGIITSLAFPRPSATAAPVNPATVGELAYLGCFGSSTGFPTFLETKDSADMTLELCLDACEGSAFAGVFESKCYCASALDAYTSATSAEDGGVCDHACPGNGSEFCGGLVERPAGWDDDDDDDDNSMEQQLFGIAMPPDMWRAPLRRVVRRAIPNTHLLTVYGPAGSSDNGSAPPPPPMATGSSAPSTNTVTMVTVYRTMYPLKSVRSAEDKMVVDGDLNMPSSTHKPVVVTDMPAATVCGGEAVPPPAPEPADQETATALGMMPNSTTFAGPPVVTAAAPLIRGEIKLTAALGAAVLALAMVL